MTMEKEKINVGQTWLARQKELDEKACPGRMRLNDASNQEAPGLAYR